MHQRLTTTRTAASTQSPARRSNRPYYPTKEAWARAEHDSLMKQASDLEKQSSGGSYAKAARKMRSVNNLRAQARKYSDMAAAFAKKGV